MRRFVVVCVLSGLLCVGAALADSGQVIGSIDIGGTVVQAHAQGECLVFAQRVSAVMGCPIPRVGGDGAAFRVWDRIVSGETKNFAAYPNGSNVPPEPWDFIVWRGGPSGHIQVVKAADLGQFRVQIVEQNWPKREGEVWLSCRYLDKGWWLESRLGYEPLGWVRTLKGKRPPVPRQVVCDAVFRYIRGGPFPGYEFWILSAGERVVVEPGVGVAAAIINSQNRIVARGVGTFSVFLKGEKEGNGATRYLVRIIKAKPYDLGRVVIRSSAPQSIRVLQVDCHWDLRICHYMVQYLVPRTRDENGLVSTRRYQGVGPRLSVRMDDDGPIQSYHFAIPAIGVYRITLLYNARLSDYYFYAE